jgi:NhaP-type Na+/H+ or K+/H+ antiporter
LYTSLAILAALLLLYSLVAAELEKHLVNGPVIFLLFGLALGPAGLGVIQLGEDEEAETLAVLAELTLALVLFTDAAKANLRVVSGSASIPVRMLLIALPSTIALGFFTCHWLLPGDPLWSIALMAAVLAPTDAALGKAVGSNKAVPLSIRQSLNVESGLNDGLCVPVVIVFATLAIGMPEGGTVGALAARHALEQLGIGTLVGVVGSLVAIYLLQRALEYHWLAGPWQRLPMIALPTALFACAQALGGSGFIAAFVGGLVFSRRAAQIDIKADLIDAAEGIGEAMAFITWVTFGAIVLHWIPSVLTPMHVLVAVLALTVFRMVPVYVSLTGSGLSRNAKLFLGWFGPRGLASIVFAVWLIELDVPEAYDIAAVVTVVVVGSILAHGLTAKPLAEAFARSEKARRAGSERPDPT